MSFGAEHVEDPGIIIAGIGSSIPFRNVRHALYDEMHWVSFDHGLAATVALLRRHGVFAGLSSGCGYLVARREAARDRGRRVLLLAADTGHRYVDAVYAHHAEAGDIDTFAPAYVDSLAALALPWAALRWAGREHPRAQAQDWPPQRPLRCPPPHHDGLASGA
jgi:cysteine synthase A